MLNCDTTDQVKDLKLKHFYQSEIVMTQKCLCEHKSEKDKCICKFIEILKIFLPNFTEVK